eukprot:7217485-Pyramimonas_sp.AAC.1
MRLIHCHCPFGKAWYRGIFVRHDRPRLPDHAHGYAAHRSRQNAQLVAKLHSWRLRKKLVPHLQVKKDMSNAFPSTDHESLWQVIGEVIPDMQDQLFRQHRHREAAMEIQAGEER